MAAPYVMTIGGVVFRPVRPGSPPAAPAPAPPAGAPLPGATAVGAPGAIVLGPVVHEPIPAPLPLPELRERLRRIAEEIARRDPAAGARLRGDIERAIGDAAKSIPPDAVVDVARRYGRVVSALASSGLALLGELELAAVSKDGKSALLVYRAGDSVLGVSIALGDGSLSFKVLPTLDAVAAELKSILSTYGPVA